MGKQLENLTFYLISQCNFTLQKSFLYYFYIRNCIIIIQTFILPIVTLSSQLRHFSLSLLQDLTFYIFCNCIPCRYTKFCIFFIFILFYTLLILPFAKFARSKLLPSKSKFCWQRRRLLRIEFSIHYMTKITLYNIDWSLWKMFFIFRLGQEVCLLGQAFPLTARHPVRISSLKFGSLLLVKFYVEIKGGYPTI